MLRITEMTLGKLMLKSTKGISNCFVTENKKGQLALETEGVNFEEAFRHEDLVELERLQSNDVKQVA